MGQLSSGAVLNERFFDLKKEKQDRMINAALKVFATAGYAHASTDDIVREAGVSKGLLFHYFTSKLGLYTFLYDYAVKYEQLEISTTVGRGETDYFRMREQLLRARVSCMRGYPWLMLFLDRADREENEEARDAIRTQVIAHAQQLRELLERSDTSQFRPEADRHLVDRILSDTFRAILEDTLRRREDVPDSCLQACGEVLSMMQKLCRREEETPSDP